MAHAIRCIWPKFVKVHFLNFSYDHKDYTNFDYSIFVIMKNFPEPVGLETDISLQDGNKSEISDWERHVRRWGKNRKKLVFLNNFI